MYITVEFQRASTMQNNGRVLSIRAKVPLEELFLIPSDSTGIIIRLPGPIAAQIQKYNDEMEQANDLA